MDDDVDEAFQDSQRFPNVEQDGIGGLAPLTGSMTSADTRRSDAGLKGHRRQVARAQPSTRQHRTSSLPLDPAGAPSRMVSLSLRASSSMLGRMELYLVSDRLGATPESQHSSSVSAS